MRILWHMPTLRRAGCGLSRRAVEMARRLAALHGHAITFVVEAGKTDVGDGTIGGLPVQVLPDVRRRAWHWSVQALARRWAASRQVERMLNDRALPHDLFVSCQPEAVGAYRAAQGPAPVLFVCGGTTLLHDAADEIRQAPSSILRRLPYRLDRRRKRENERLAFSAADAVVFDSNHTREAVITTYGIQSQQCHTVYGGVDAVSFQPATPEQKKEARTSLGLSSTGTTIVWAGRLSSEKNVELLLRALPLCQSPPDGVLLVGDGPDATVLQRLAVCDLSLGNRVKFLGEQPDVRPFLHAADIFAFPSRGESFGGALAEAMACGLACIAVRPNGREIRTASTEIIEHGQSGLLVDPPTPKAFATALDELASNAVERRRLGGAARCRAAAQFTWDGAARRLGEIISELVRGPGRSDIARGQRPAGGMPPRRLQTGDRAVAPQNV